MSDTPPVVDWFQQRYLAHQGRKKRTLIEIMRSRHSDRMFDDRPVDEPVREQVREVVDACPSSCDRRGVSVGEVDARDERELLGGLLVGGVGWVHRAPWILLLWGDPLAYKAGNESLFMPFLDAGVLILGIQLRTTDLGLAAAYINPNIRPHNRDHFLANFAPAEGAIFGGAIAVGYSHPDSPDRLRAIADGRLSTIQNGHGEVRADA